MFDIYLFIQPIFVGRGQASSVVQLKATIGIPIRRVPGAYTSAWMAIGGTKMRHSLDSI